MAVDTREVGVLSAHWLLSSERFRRGIGSVIQQGCVDPSDLRSPSKHRIYVGSSESPATFEQPGMVQLVSSRMAGSRAGYSAKAGGVSSDMSLLDTGSSSVRGWVVETGMILK